MCVTGVFPEPEIDPVIQIASMVQRQGEKEPFIRTVFTLQSCASIVGSQILCFTQEKLLLQVHVHYTDTEMLTCAFLLNVNVHGAIIIMYMCEYLRVGLSL